MKTKYKIIRTPIIHSINEDETDKKFIDPFYRYGTINNPMLFKSLTSALDYFNHLKETFDWFDYVLDAPIDYMYQDNYPIQVVKCFYETDEWNANEFGEVYFYPHSFNDYRILPRIIGERNDKY
ncbi:MAG: hypothetical protein RSD53_11650 [Algoriella sp.]|uniref:hypothetical protein n=1 Tax=Algoriella sp. TaxID=1872434 RepID=UPI002FCABE5F